MLHSVSTSVLLASPLWIFIGKMLACGFLGFIILGGLRLLIDSLMNPNGWKFGNELYDHNEDKFANGEKEKAYDFQYVRSEEEPWKRFKRRN